MWRGDAQHSGATGQALPGTPQLAWSLRLPPLEPTWEEAVNQDRMPYDVGYEPIVVGNRLFVSSNRNDSVTAYDTRTGRQLWRTYLDAPVRFPPAAANDRLYVTCDDGRLYVLAQTDGAKLGAVQGGLDDRLVMGNGRLVSPWCARGGPVAFADRVYFAAGIWPFMGTFIQAVDPTSLGVLWQNDSAGTQYLSQPHEGAEAFGGVAPQGALAGVGGQLLVPSGRSVPARFDAATGKLAYFHLEGSPGAQGADVPNRKLEGGSQVAMNGTYHVNWRGIATVLYESSSGGSCLAWQGAHAPVLTGDRLYLGGAEELLAFDLGTLKREAYEVKVTDRKTGEVQQVTRYRWVMPPLWRAKVPSQDALILAGDTLVAASGGQIQALRIVPDDAPTPVWEATVPGTVTQLLAAADRLFAVTREGAIHAFAADGKGTEIAALPPANPSLATDANVAALASRLSVPQGWGVVFGVQQPERLEAILRHTPLRVAAFAADAETCNRLRQHFDERGLYGTRLSVRVGRPGSPALPPYFAALVIHEGESVPAEEQQVVGQILRPYGGLAWFPHLAIPAPGLASPQFQQEAYAGGALFTEPGQLPGAADWTHLYGDLANTAKSNDQRVRLPLGLLWFGGNSHADVLPRHAHGPSEIVMGGRLFLQGIDVLSARDVYTGNVFWRREVDGLETLGDYYDQSHNPDPTDITYNQIHIPGSNARGTNLVAASDALYLLRRRDCLVIDPVTGKTLKTLQLPPEQAGGEAPEWAYIGVAGPWLVAGAEFARLTPPPPAPKPGEKPKAPNPFASYDRTSSRRLLVLDRHTGEVKWQRPADFAFRHSAICVGGDTLFCIDAVPPSLAGQQERRGQVPQSSAVLALDLATGAVRWQNRETVFGTWLAYSAEHRVIVQCGRASRDMLRDEPKDRMAVLKAASGEVVWDRKIPHGGPVMLHGDRIILPAPTGKGGALDLLTGEPFQQPHPITGTPEPWSYFRRYGCNSVIAAEHLLAFRSGAAGFCDLDSPAGTGNFGGFKSGCSTNLIAADGVLNAPDYTRTCTCSYQNQASLALVPMPDLESWTANAIAYDPAASVVRELGLNLGAPGDRRENDGLLWFEYPIVGGPSPTLPVALEPSSGTTPYQLYSARFSGPLPWVAASGIEGVRSVRIRLRNLDPIRTLALPVADGADDGEESKGQTNLTSSDLELTRDGQNEQLIGLRFRNVPLAPGDQIGSARLRFTVKTPSKGETTLRIRAEAATAAALISSGLAKRATGTAAVSWSPPAWGTAEANGNDQCSPDIAPLLREWLDRPDWQADNALVLLIDGTGDRCAWSANGKATAAPVLEITYQRPAPTPAPLLCDVRLVFAEPQATTKPGQRQFAVTVQGQALADSLDLAVQPGSRTAWLLERQGVNVDEWLEIGLIPTGGSPLPPVLSGISVRVLDPPVPGRAK